MVGFLLSLVYCLLFSAFKSLEFALIYIHVHCTNYQVASGIGLLDTNNWHIGKRMMLEISVV